MRRRRGDEEEEGAGGGIKLFIFFRNSFLLAIKCYFHLFIL